MVNERMPQRVADNVITALAARDINPNGASVIVFGAAYKPNIGDCRHSPAIKIVETLQQRLDVTVVDPHVYHREVGVTIEAEVTNEAIAAVDGVIILVDHDTFDFSRIGEHATLVYDSKNVMPENTEATVVTLGEKLVDQQDAIQATANSNETI
jgi:UDP-N-acetyl-D-glucosamine dehydrogenase